MANDDYRHPGSIHAGLALLRVILGIVFIAHGGQKLFQYGIAGVTQGFGQMGVPLPAIAAPVVTGVELLGGILLVVGLFTRVVASLTAIDMLGATLLVHLKNGFFGPMGIEFTLTLCAASLAFVLAGPGAFSLDAVIARRRSPRLAAEGRV